MTLILEVQVETSLSEKEKEALSWVETCVEAAAKVEGRPQVEVAITLVDDEAIHQLNLEYRGVDRPTDVLSFPQWEREELAQMTESEEPLLLGDIVISIPRAREQAHEYQHSFEREIGFLAVHGFLHLLGYDHMTEEEEQVMFARQDAILAEVNLQR
ncbi:rRNA maturation RNase YbeY [Mechercharimyces sp. CAU 1602]|uniref:rRNA maturation RNase YbeY n=1 Tax=Mechercharimyces sp. CAU 1602 TaxID=2973933 RepID=UPI002161DFE3|nr:rRNA maturation RNase YbeY [Mechercharimyces sp. CAU 1602]MCS1350473.1 rRNA maturation RNase YbeY [Mechercharimyces sp. CAU 1602]